MNKAEFFEQLKAGLSKLPASEREEIIADYEEHFRIALSKGKSEEQICKDMGSVEQIVMDYRIDRVVADQVTGTTGHLKSITRAGLILLALAPLNFIVFMGPFLAGVVTLITTWSVALALVAVGFWCVALAMPALVSLVGPVVALTGMGIVFMGVVFALLLVPVTQWCGMMTFRYLKWNLSFARGK
jgi:uncharacterized membrane protein